MIAMRRRNTGPGPSGMRQGGTTMANERTITVTGRGMLHLAPDLVRLTLSVSAADSDFAKAVRAAEESGARVKKALEQGGAAQVKAAGVRTEPLYETVTENGGSVRRQTGYTAMRRLRAELSADPALLAQVLTALADSGASPALSAEYTLADEDKARRHAAALAVKDARKRAEAIAKAAGVRLDGVRTVQSGPHGTFPAVRAMAMRANDLSDLSPEEIEISEEVTVIFDIG